MINPVTQKMKRGEPEGLRRNLQTLALVIIQENTIKGSLLWVSAVF